MEHEQRIREKVLMAEESLSTWNKEFVWSAIPHTNESRRPMAVYFAAASVALAAAIVFYSIETTNRQALQVQIAKLELSVEQAVSARITESTNHVTQVIDCPVDQPADAPKYAKKKSTLQRTEAEPVSAIAVAIHAPIQEVVPLKQLEANPEVQVTTYVASSVTFVRPIIGTSWSLASKEASTRDPWIQIRLFQMDEPQRTTSTGTIATNFATISNQ